MAKGVIDALKSVDIDKKYGISVMVGPLPVMNLLEMIQKERAVGQTGQYVKKSQLMDLVLSLLP